MATLDSITGDEFVREVEPVGILAPPRKLSSTEAIRHLQQMINILDEDGRARGATRSLRMKLSVAHFEGASIQMWSDSTLRFFKKFP